ncbi:MAG: PAS domain S-box protein [Spirulinaceae cyanobacterium RM2_2_10]|nr:PAS domain S-box protein [Spirulinaceae cyanobacterium RM2_2_10]
MSISPLMLNCLFSSSLAKVHQFTDCPQELKLGQDARLAFPELVGIETILQEILCGQRSDFELQGIARSTSDGRTLYLNLTCEKIGDNLILLAEDVTEMMVLRQSLMQRANEAELLLSALTASEDYNKKIISSMGDALFVTTVSGSIKTANQAAQKLFHYTESELIGTSISKIITDRDFLYRASQQNLLSGDFLKNVEVLCRTQDSQEIIVEFSCSAIQTTTKGLLAFVYIGRDITERKRAEAETNRALAQQKELNELKSRFVSMTSHEFRTPLTSILMSVDLLENFADQWSETKKQTHLQRIRQCSLNMKDLLEDVLTIGRAESGKLDFKPSLLDPAEFCCNLAEEMQLTIGQQHTIQFICQADLIRQAWLDEKLLRHIFTNLLSNAIKYSPQGGTVDFTLTRTGDHLQFIVRDHGIGIPPDDCQHIFDSFHRARNVRDIAGTGLGLAIVKKAVDLHRGKIECSSTVGLGTSFQVCLPLTKAAESSGLPDHL